MTPAARPHRHVVARLSDVPEGTAIIVDVAGRSIGIFHKRGRFYAILNRCPHKGAELCRGTVVGALSSPSPSRYEYDSSHPYLQCPWHGWEFDLATGQSYCDPEVMRVRCYEVDTDRGETLQGDLTKGNAVLAKISDARSTHGSGYRRLPYIAETFQVRVESDCLVRLGLASSPTAAARSITLPMPFNVHLSIKGS
jgi:3-phenylpropionate/trans-cinnamate dioxygenase ferredoxin subunit